MAPQRTPDVALCASHAYSLAWCTLPSSLLAAMPAHSGSPPPMCSPRPVHTHTHTHNTHTQTHRKRRRRTCGPLSATVCEPHGACCQSPARRHGHRWGGLQGLNRLIIMAQALFFISSIWNPTHALIPTLFDRDMGSTGHLGTGGARRCHDPGSTASPNSPPGMRTLTVHGCRPPVQVYQRGIFTTRRGLRPPGASYTPNASGPHASDDTSQSVGPRCIGKGVYMLPHPSSLKSS